MPIDEDPGEHTGVQNSLASTPTSTTPRESTLASTPMSSTPTRRALHADMRAQWTRRNKREHEETFGAGQLHRVFCIFYKYGKQTTESRALRPRRAHCAMFPSRAAPSHHSRTCREARTLTRSRANAVHVERTPGRAPNRLGLAN